MPTTNSASSKNRSSRERSCGGAECSCSPRSATTPHAHRFTGEVSTSKKRLSSGLAAAGRFGLVDRAEPARALADLHLDLRVPAAGRLVIDAFARAVDIALDGAVGRGRDFAGGRG